MNCQLENQMLHATTVEREVDGGCIHKGVIRFLSFIHSFFIKFGVVMKMKNWAWSTMHARESNCDGILDSGLKSTRLPRYI